MNQRVASDSTHGMPFVLDKILQRVGYNNGYRSWLCREYMSAPHIPEDNLNEESRDKDNSVLWSVQEYAIEEERGINLFGQVKTRTGVRTRWPGVYSVARVMISGGPDEWIEHDGKEKWKCGICGEIGHSRRECERNHECPNCGYEDPVVIFQSLETPMSVPVYLDPFTGVPIFTDEYSYRCIFCKF